MQFKRITTDNVQDYEFMERLLKESFPSEEYRALEQLREYTDRKKEFYNNVIFDGERRIGFITYWDFGHFYYAEHFATDPTVRNGGYGKRILEALCRHLSRPIVLEVECPDNEIARRRIGFYQRQGFQLWEKEYRQPPYKEGDSFLPMYLMAYGDLDAERDFEEVRRTLHSKVYGLEQ